MPDTAITDLNLAEITNCRQRLHGRVHSTPVMTSMTLNRMLGCELYFKCEHLQKTGAFKYRGACNAVLQVDSDVRAVATHSSGNHGAALAAAARNAGMDAHIVMPENSVPTKIQAVQAYGGSVHFCEPTHQAREDTLRSLIDQGHHKIHPYDDWRIIFGQGTATAELIDDVPDMDLLVAPVGGGGLISGACLAIQASGKPIRIIAAEPAGADDTYRSLQAGERITSVKPDTIADGLRATLGERNFMVMREYLDQVVLVDDDETMQALGLVWRHMKQLIEPSCATVVAAIAKRADLFSGKRVGVILSGGNVDIEKLLGALR